MSSTAHQIHTCADCGDLFCLGCEGRASVIRCVLCSQVVCTDCSREANNDPVRRGRCHACGHPEEDPKPYRILPAGSVELPPAPDPKAWREGWKRKQKRSLRRLGQLPPDRPAPEAPALPSGSE